MKKQKKKIINVAKHTIYPGRECDGWVQLIYDGRLIDLEVNRLGVVRFITYHGICGVHLLNGYKCIDIDGAPTGIHRILAAVFIPIPEHYIQAGRTQLSLVPNHIDGNRLNNDLSNLEWCTPKENADHAFDTGLANSSTGENSHLAKITEEVARKICEMLQDGYTTTQISEKLGVSKKIAQHIRAGECWKRVSKDYNFAVLRDVHPYDHTDVEIMKICEMLQDGYSVPYISKTLGISDRYIYRIRNRETRLDISKDYRFNQNAQRLTKVKHLQS